MSNKTYHAISASEDEQVLSSDDEQEDYKGIAIVEDKSPGGLVKSQTLKDILSKVKGVKYNFKDVKSSNSILYSNEITEDEEIWLIQTPKDVSLELLEETNFKFKDSSRMTLKARKREKHFNVHVIQSKKEGVNSLLPVEETQSFHMTLCPVAGRIILQEDFQVDSKNESLNNTASNSSLCILESNVDSADSQSLDTDSITPLKKKKRKSIKQDTISN